MKYNDIAQPWSAGATAAQKVLPTRRNAPFILMHHPKNWELHIFKVKKDKRTVDVPLLIPSLTKIIEDCGVNNVTGTADRPDSSFARTKFKDSGHTILHPSEHDYIRIYPAAGGKYHTTKFMIIEDLAGQMIKTMKVDEYADFRRLLVKNGHISLPHPHICRKKTLEQEQQMNRLASKPHIPSAVTRLKELQDKSKQLAIAAKNSTKVSSYEI